MNPEYPIYVISKGRWKSRLTARALDRMQVLYRIVVEPQEERQYSAVIDPAKVLVTPFSNLGQGSIPVRNFVWDHAIENGAKRHWIMDDNITEFYRLNGNIKMRTMSGTIFYAAEHFVDRYTNVPMAGLQYEMFVPRKRKHPPFLLNTRIYSCILLDNKCQHRWRGRYNEDTDLSLRVLKSGDCTILFNAFLCNKTATMTMKGGNTDELYKQDGEFDGRLEMAKSLHRQHPDVVKITRKWGRWQHHVDYRPFKRNRLKKRLGVKVTAGVDNFGMVMVHKKAKRKKA